MGGVRRRADNRAADLAEHPAPSARHHLEWDRSWYDRRRYRRLSPPPGRRRGGESKNAARQDAAAAERERIARGIHDSVLQVLALVSARGRALGGEAAELGVLAGEQEAALRTLLTAGRPAPPDQRLLDLRISSDPLAVARITVSCPATPVLLPAVTATALAAAVAAALDNVARHAGPDARAWVLVEDEDST